MTRTTAVYLLDKAEHTPEGSPVENSVVTSRLDGARGQAVLGSKTEMRTPSGAKVCRARPRILEKPPLEKGTSVRFATTDRFWRGRMTQAVIQRNMTKLQLYRRLSKPGDLSARRFQKLLRDLRPGGLLAVGKRRVRVAA